MKTWKMVKQLSEQKYFAYDTCMVIMSKKKCKYSTKMIYLVTKNIKLFFF